MTIPRSVKPWYRHWRPGVKCLRKKNQSNRPWYGHWGLLNLYGHWWVKNLYRIKNSKNKKIEVCCARSNLRPQEQTTDESAQKFKLYDAFQFWKLAESTPTCCQGVHHIAYMLLLHVWMLFVAYYQSMLTL